MTSSLMIDFLMLCLLLATIVYAARLSLQLRKLRDSKSELDKTVRQLMGATDKAYAAMQGLRLSAQEQGQDLQDVIDKAVILRDELQVMTDSGERLSGKLEKLVDKGRPLVAGSPVMPKSVAAAPQQPSLAPKPQPSAAAPTLAAKKPLGGFAIRDPEAERGIDLLQESKVVAQDDAEGLSAAERDLLRAIGATRGVRK